MQPRRKLKSPGCSLLAAVLLRLDYPAAKSSIAGQDDLGALGIRPESSKQFQAHADRSAHCCEFVVMACAYVGTGIRSPKPPATALGRPVTGCYWGRLTTCSVESYKVSPGTFFCGARVAAGVAGCDLWLENPAAVE